MLEELIRNTFCKLFTGNKKIALENKVPPPEILKDKFNNINEIGLYLHIPFCDRICPYCPYNKEVYEPQKAKKYTQAVKKEIDQYCQLINNIPVTSFYIGGGTPTTMLHSGLEDIINYIYAKFNMQCDIHMESHPTHLSAENLSKIKALGVENLSIGIEALQDKHLKTLKRPYSANEAKDALARVMKMNFKCVNTDLIFALPGQTCAEVVTAGRQLIETGVNQVAAYPLFRFPYTKMGSEGRINNFKVATIFKRRKMLRLLEKLFSISGFERSSVWAFTKKDEAKYCSVTVPRYIGLGASGSTYLNDIFYLNTFNVTEYIRAIDQRRNAIALSVSMNRKLQMTGWLYWRIYETKFRKSDFNNRFGEDIDELFGKYIKLLWFLGLLKDDGYNIVLSDRGSYWLHAFEDIFSIDYISTLWGNSKNDPWPTKIIL